MRQQMLADVVLNMAIAEKLPPIAELDVSLRLELAGPANRLPLTQINVDRTMETMLVSADSVVRPPDFVATPLPIVAPGVNPRTESAALHLLEEIVDQNTKTLFALATNVALRLAGVA